MGFILLVVVGGILGWLASIVTRRDLTTDILADVVVGIVGSLVVGLIANGESILGGLSAKALLLALIGSVVSLALFNLVYRRTATRS